jgi:hypothetical protein
VGGRWVGYEKEKRRKGRGIKVRVELDESQISLWFAPVHTSTTSCSLALLSAT